MRKAFACVIALLAACDSEPDFDERYERTEREIRVKAAEIDAGLEKNTATGNRNSPVKSDAPARSGEPLNE